MPADALVIELRQEIASRLNLWSHKPLKVLGPSGELLSSGGCTLADAGLVDGSCRVADFAN